MQTEALSQKCQKEGQEDQGTLKQKGGVPPCSFTSPWSSWPSCWVTRGVRAGGASAEGVWGGQNPPHP